MLRLLRILLFPLSFLYGVAISVRGLLYRIGWFKVTSFSERVIVIGNLAVGGAGKSPMTEYLVRLLKTRHKIAVLSRGYGRKTKGYRDVLASDHAAAAGDEPLQFKTKFPDIAVAVSEKRVPAIIKLLKNNDLVILDDAFQHRAVEAGLNILLFDYNRIFDFQMLLPSGDLREPMNARKRAQVIVVTKTPADLDETGQQRIRRQIAPGPQQELFFSYLEYGELTSLDGKETVPLKNIHHTDPVLLLTGIANSQPLAKLMEQYSSRVIHHRYPDHHQYTRKNIAKLANASLGMEWVITTEKDAQRLRSPEFEQLLGDLRVYYLPIEAKIHRAGETRFNEIITAYVNRH